MSDRAQAGIAGTLKSALNCHQAGDLGQAESLYKQVIDNDPNNIDALHLLGVVYNQLHRYELGIKYIQQAITMDPMHPEFFQNLGNSWWGAKNYSAALSSYQQALELAPQQAGELIAVITEAFARLDQAEQGLEFLQELGNEHPELEHSVKLYKMFLHNHLRQFALSVNIADDVKLKDIENLHEDFYIYWGTALSELSKTSAAEEAFAKGLNFYPNSPQLLYGLANVYYFSKRYQQAIDIYQKIISINPNFIEAYNNLGLAYLEENRIADAITVWQQGIDTGIQYPQIYFNIANLYQDLGDHARAAEIYSELVMFASNYLKAYINLGNSCRELNKFSKAEHAYRYALELEPLNEEAQYNLGIIYLEERKLKQAKKYLENLYAGGSQQPYLYGKLYLLYRHYCKWTEAQNIDGVITASQQVEETPYINVLRCQDFATNLKVAKHWAENINSNLHSNFIMPVESKSTRDKRIKIGYLSADYKEHATMHLISGLFKNHDRKKFAVHAYSYGNNDNSSYRQKVEVDCEYFHDIKNLSTPEIVTLIRQHGIDILIDLKGYSQDSRIDICAYRPAKIQINYLGFPGTMGASYMDYIIVDNNIVTTDEEQYFVEKILRMPHTYQITDNQQVIAEHKFKRSDFNLPENKFVYACFNQVVKIDRATIESWLKILQNSHDSVLWIYCNVDVAKECITSFIQLGGIDPQRIIYCDYLPKDQHLARIQLADLVLDTFTYNGHTCTTDSLWAGVPVLTLYGKHFASRVSASILRAANLPELVTHACSEYISQAVNYAENPDKIISLKQHLQNKYSLPLFQTQEFVKQLENIYLNLYQDHAEGNINT